MKRYVVLLAVMALLMVALAVPAFAAPQGKFEQGPEHANSECSYSGLNDDPDEAGPGGGRTQSFGQLVKKGVIAPGDEPGREAPGFACNGHLSPLK